MSKTVHPAFVPFAITVCGVEELYGHCDVGVSHVLSMLDPGTPQPDAFGEFGEHARLEMRFHDVIEDEPHRPGPQVEHVERLLAFGRDLLAEPPADAHLLVHCWAGVSRSTAAMTLLLAQARPDRSAAEALAQVVKIRPVAWPNLRMIEIGDRMLGRNGDLVRAAHARYAAVLEEQPFRAQQMIMAGRGREIPPHLRR